MPPQLLDQRKLPFVVEHVVCHDSDEVASAIHAGLSAPAIGIAAAWGVVLAAREVQAADGAHALQQLEPALQRLNASRPTAVNLAWAGTLPCRRRRLEGTAGGRSAGHRRGRPGRQPPHGRAGRWLDRGRQRVLTHCNTGSLATAGFGTALGVIRAGMAQHRIARVFAGETGRGCRAHA